MVQALAAGQVGWQDVEDNPRRLHADAKALEALAIGDRRGALSILMQAYGDLIHRYCFNVLRNRAQAEDALQLVFLQAFEALGSFTGSSFRSWLYGIANHRCLDTLKVNRRWFSRFILGDNPPEEMDESPSGEDTAVAKSTTEALSACLGKLKPHVRIAVVLRYQEGFTYEEMSEICGERPATLQARVARALPLLRQCLELKGIDP